MVPGPLGHSIFSAVVFSAVVCWYEGRLVAQAFKARHTANKVMTMRGRMVTPCKFRNILLIRYFSKRIILMICYLNSLIIFLASGISRWFPGNFPLDSRCLPGNFPLVFRFWCGSLPPRLFALVRGGFGSVRKPGESVHVRQASPVSYYTKSLEKKKEQAGQMSRNRPEAKKSR
jgi:hypothetical protein